MSSIPMTSIDAALPRQMYQYYSAMGINVHVHHDIMRMEFVISAVASGGASISKRVPDNSDVPLMQMVIRSCVEQVQSSNKDNTRESRIHALENELSKYKATVKQLAFDLEMKSTTPRAVATEADVRKQTLEMAAEFLMDYGVICTGPELVSVCEQMKKLHPSRAAVMAEAAKKMAAGWTQYDPR